MSRNVFRLHKPVKRPALSWSTAPQACESLLALTHWLLGGNKAEAVQIAAMHDEVNPLPNALQAEAVRAHAPLSQMGESKGRQPHLKVVMVRDAQNPQAPSPGRLVISGRMADVCAELDRLAA